MSAVVAPEPAPCPPVTVTSVQRALARVGETSPFTLACLPGTIRLDVGGPTPVRVELSEAAPEAPWVGTALARLVEVRRLEEAAAAPSPVVVADSPPPVPSPPEMVETPRPRSAETHGGWLARLLGRWSAADGRWIPGIECVRRRGAWDLGAMSEWAWRAVPQGVVRAQHAGVTAGRTWTLTEWRGVRFEVGSRVQAGAVRLEAAARDGVSGGAARWLPQGDLTGEVGARWPGAGGVPFGIGLRAGWRVGPAATVDGGEVLSWRGPVATVVLAAGGS